MAKSLTSFTSQHVADTIKPALQQLFEANLEVSVGEISYTDAKAITLNKVSIKQTNTVFNPTWTTSQFYLGLGLGGVCGLIVGWGICKGLIDERNHWQTMSKPILVQPKHQLLPPPPILFNQGY
jgi:hypothetical protein